MSPLLYALQVFFGMVGIIVVLSTCGAGAWFLCSMARRAWKDLREWLAIRWARHFIDDIRKMI